MNARLHRLIVLVSGQPDAWATPMNSRHGMQHVDTREAWKGCAGGMCNQGRNPERCDCKLHVLHPHLHRITLTEIDNDVAPDPSRTFSGLTSAEIRAKRERNAARVRAGAVAVFWTVALAALCAALMSGMRG